jgi:hypothetical protein
MKPEKKRKAVHDETVELNHHSETLEKAPKKEKGPWKLILEAKFKRKEEEARKRVEVKVARKVMSSPSLRNHGEGGG